MVPSTVLRQQELDKCQDPDENTLPCDHTYKYRTYNGWCNNLNNPQYGKSVTSLVRFLSAKYDDGNFSPLPPFQKIRYYGARGIKIDCDSITR